MACIILRLDKEDYLAIGSGVVITYSPAESSSTWQPGDARIGLALCEAIQWDNTPKKNSDKVQDDNVFNPHNKPLRRLNGDQTHQGRHVRIPVGQFDIQHFRLYRYK